MAFARELNCRDCLWGAQCDEVGICDDFSPIDEECTIWTDEGLVDIETYIGRERQEFSEYWIEYIGDFE